MSRQPSSDPAQAFVYCMYALVFCWQFDNPSFCPCPKDHRTQAWRNIMVMLDLMNLEVLKCTVGSRRTSAGG